MTAERRGSLRGRTALRVGSWWAVASLLVAPLVMRAALIANTGTGLQWVDLRGIVADVGVSSIAAAAFAWIPANRGPIRFAAPGSILVWVFAHYANFETVTTLGSLASIRDAAYLTDQTFVLGSAMAISHPILLGAVTLGSLAPISIMWQGRPSIGGRGYAAAGVLLLALHGLWPWAAGAEAWRQTSFLREGVVDVGSGLRRASLASRNASESSRRLTSLVPGLAADLAGEPIGELALRDRNVLLVVLESVSGAYIASLSADHGRPGATYMPHLDDVARKHLSFSTFIAHQRRTNRGLYTLLCGELPSLLPGLPKMSAYPERGGRRCLPRILGDAGYQTAYLQAAPLAFMLKDQFMRNAGFDQVYGDDWFERSYSRSRWGVDDRAFLEQSLDLIDTLREGQAPWFLTLLTVGTHHPFVVPNDFAPEKRTAFGRTLAYLDIAIGRFVTALGERGITDDTLVLITSDESFGIRGLEPDLIAREVSENWGFLIVIAPEKYTGRRSEPFGQIDIALSILDYLGRAESEPDLMGRSAFRRYETSRFLFFANNNHLLNGAIDPIGRLLICRNSFARCVTMTPANKHYFGRDRRSAPMPEYDEQLLRRIADASITPEPDAAGPRRIRLHPLSRVTLPPHSQTLLHGGQYASLRPGEWLEVDVEFDVVGVGPGIRVGHHLRAFQRPDPYTTVLLASPGETVRFHYTYSPDRAIDGLQSHSVARNLGDEDLHLDFRRAHLLLHTEGQAPLPGVKIFAP